VRRIFGQLGREVIFVDEAAAEGRMAASAAPTGPQPNLAAQIRELAELRDQGILMPEEFEVQKARLLRSS
jgi:Short C-terminal domain